MSAGDREAGRRAAIAEGRMDIEDELRRLTPAAVPPGLRSGVMSRAGEARTAAALTPPLRAVAAVCAILIAGILLAEPFVARHERSRLTALLDGRQAVRPAADDAAVLAEIAGGAGQPREAARWVRLGQLAASAARRQQVRQNTEARKRLKGWLEHEASEDLE